MRRRNILIGAGAVVVALIVIGTLAKPGTPASSPPVGAGSADTPPPDLTGQIVFGTTVDSDSMTVASPVTSAKVSSAIGWVAYLSDAAKGTTLTLTIANVSSGGAETPVS